MKKVVALALVFMLAACGVDGKQKITDAYNLTDTEHVFELITLDELEETIKNRPVSYVYFGSPICPACVRMTPRINQHAKDAGVSVVYYVEFRYDSELAREWSQNGTYDYRGTPLVATFLYDQFERSNFTDLPQGGDYEANIIDMFETYGCGCVATS